ncbi:MAG: TolC family protein, partial [Gemmatimonadetes bacterium]|nr:TolC family protein [Gemmatimonadota bacterium]
MRARSILWLPVALAACAVGPSYHAAPAVAPDVGVTTPARHDSSHAFVDSLAAARAAGRAPGARTATTLTLRYDANSGVAWLDILHDTTLERLVRTAVAQNRSVQSAAARIREYRAMASSVRTQFYPNVTLNGTESTNQIAFGSNVFGYRAARLTGDMSWELDFWGKVRRGYEAATADAAAQDAAERAVLLSLVSDVAQGYLQLLELDQERVIAERTLA